MADTLNHLIEANIISKKPYWLQELPDVMNTEGHITSMVFIPKLLTTVSSWETSDQLKSRGVLQNTNQSSSKSWQCSNVLQWVSAYVNRGAPWRTQQEEWKQSMHTTTWIELKGITVSEMKESPEVAYCKIVFTKRSCKGQNSRGGEEMNGCHVGEWEGQGDNQGSFPVYPKGSFWWNCSLVAVTQIHTWQNYIELSTQHTYTQKNPYESGGIWIKSMDYINVHFLVVTLLL